MGKAVTPRPRPANRLRGLRRDRGWSLREAAERAGIALGQLSRLERGRAVPLVDTAMRLAGLYGATVEAVWAGAAGEK